MPATPMNEAADRYSPEMAEAFQPTETERPATKKSLAVFDVRAERNPIQIVTATVTAEKAKIQGSTPSSMAREESKLAMAYNFLPALTALTSSSSKAIERRMKIHEIIQTNGKNSTPRMSQLSVNPATRIAMVAGLK